MTPLISVLLPTKNRLTYLRYAVETVRRQDYPHWEIIISDNHSDEDISGYVSSLNEPRIIYMRTDHPLQVTDNWNNALEHAHGDYLIMLGDDDGLIKGCLSTLVNLLDRHDSPDLIFSNAFIYAYPEVVPGFPRGFLKRDASPIFKRGSPYSLDLAEAHALVRHSLRLTMAFPFNMQYSLVARRLVERMRRAGPFYQSPYPDYYATNALFLAAERILVCPDPMVIIGVSPKSYGFFHFNDREEEGALFLDNAAEESEVERLRDVLLPGTRSASAWLLAMERLKTAFPELGLEVDHRRYRRMQIATIYKRYHLLGVLPKDRYHDFRHRLSLRERWTIGFPLAILLRTSRALGQNSYRRILDTIRRCAGHSHAGSLDMAAADSCGTTCTDLLEVFERDAVPAGTATAGQSPR